MLGEAGASPPLFDSQLFNMLIVLLIRLMNFAIIMEAGDDIFMIDEQAGMV